MNIFVDSPPLKTLGEKVATPKGLKKTKKGKGLQEHPKGLEEPNNDTDKKKFIEWYIENKRNPGDTDAEILQYAEDAWYLEDTNLKPKIIKHETKKEFKKRQNHPPNWNNENNYDSLEEFMDDVTGGPKKPKNGGYKKRTNHKRTKRNKRNTRKRFKRK